MIKLLYKNLFRDIKLIIGSRNRQSKRKNVLRIICELIRYRIYWGQLFSCEYFYYNLDKAFLPFEEIKKFVPTRYHHNYQRLIRDNDYSCISTDKRITSIYLKNAGLPHPVTPIFMFNGIITDNRYNRLSELDVVKIINECDTEKIFLKPSASGGSTGIEVFVRDNNEFRSGNGSVLDYNYLTNICKMRKEGIYRGGYVLQYGIKQSRILSQINSSSTNTLKIVSYRDGQSFKILSVMLRIGREGKHIDTSVAGGIFVFVDINNFKTNNECFGLFPRRKSLGDIHPDSKTLIGGVQLPYRDEIYDIIERGSLMLYPDHPYIGWDFGLCENGPVVIEINNTFEISVHQAAWKRGIRDLLKYDPKIKPLRRLK